MHSSIFWDHSDSFEAFCGKLKSEFGSRLERSSDTLIALVAAGVQSRNMAES
jgi:hypothetical protein